MQADEKKIGQLPKVAVCLAAYNGVVQLGEQIESILTQINVDVTIFISVDKSSDGTEDLVDQYSKANNGIIVLPHGEILGSAASNFFRMLVEVNFSTFDYISFADQDDIWHSDKLISHIEIAKKNNADGVSSNVMAFWPEGRKRIINKAQPQRTYDYLFESAGPGCTFLMSHWLVGKVREVLLDETSSARNVALHDWLCYAVCRVHHRKWLIDSAPSVHYRQHEHNFLGANVGLKAKLARLTKLKQGWYREEVIKITSVCNRIQPSSEVTKKIANLLQSNSFFARIHLCAFVSQARRRFADRFLLCISILIGLF